tara:strand:+ start:239 stop:1279 length:1041 start_codon:yes stop_codon:yes gene_type:complete
MGYRVAIVGATGNVGRELLNILNERSFPADEVFAIASRKSEGKDISFGDELTLQLSVLDDFDFTGIDIALFSAGAEISRKFAPKAADAGAIIIDNTSQFRMDNDIPLIIPEVNREAISGYAARNIIANPNCSTIQMLVALKPLHQQCAIKRIVVSTYQSTSGAGKESMDELFDHTRCLYMNEQKDPEHFSKRIAFNVIPQIDTFLSDGSTKEEAKMVNETKKILGEDILVSATCVRVPTFIGHAESINVEFYEDLREDEAREILRAAAGVSVIDERKNGGYATPLDCVGEDSVFVSRIQQDPTVSYGLKLWVVSDNLRKGAALNTVQIAEELVADYLGGGISSQRI